MKWFCVLLWDGPNLYAVYGRFETRKEASEWIPRSAEEQTYKRMVCELFDPDSI